MKAEDGDEAAKESEVLKNCVQQEDIALETEFKMMASLDGDDQTFSVKDAQLIGMTKEQAKICINQFDEDKNGTASLEEYLNFVMKVMKEGDDAALDELNENCKYPGKGEQEKKVPSFFKHF